MTGPASILCHFLSFLKNAIDKRTPDPPWNFFPQNLFNELNQERITKKTKILVAVTIDQLNINVSGSTNDEIRTGLCQKMKVFAAHELNKHQQLWQVGAKRVGSILTGEELWQR